MRTRPYSSGFTLLEVMIALTIFAALAVTISSTASQAVNNTLHLEEKVLATWVAENALTQMRIQTRASQALPPQTQSKDTLEMAGREWVVKTHVEKTDFPGVVRITISVALERDKEYNLASVATILGAR
ncbi:MAG: type II secretion system minor pseudopilin GspI [Oceanobacter sp.]